MERIETFVTLMAIMYPPFGETKLKENNMLHFEHKTKFEGREVELTVYLQTKEEYQVYAYPRTLLDYHTYTRDVDNKLPCFKGRVKPTKRMPSSCINMEEAIEVIKLDIDKKAREYSDKPLVTKSCYIDTDYDWDE